MTCSLAWPSRYAITAARMFARSLTFLEALALLQALEELRHLGITASCRLSFYLYNTMADVEHAVGAVRDLVAGTIG